MATGASTAELAVLLVDARAGLQEQTRRHAAIVHLMGIRRIILAVNKIDLVDYDQAVFERIESEFRAFAGLLGGIGISAIPISALKGENVVAAAPVSMAWYEGPTLLETLEAAEDARQSKLPFRMPIQRVSRPGESFRGYQGTVAAGSVSTGARLVIQPSGEFVSVARIVTFDGDVPTAQAGEAITLVFDRPVDAARGDVLSAPDAVPLGGKAYAATIVVLQAEGLADGARLWLKAAGRHRRVRVAVDDIYDLGTGRWVKTSALPINSIGRLRLEFEEPVVFDRFEDCRDTGAFILVSPRSNDTLAGGMITDLAAAEPQRSGRVTLSLTPDLADFVLGLPEIRARMSDVHLDGQ